MTMYNYRPEGFERGEDDLFVPRKAYQYLKELTESLGINRDDLNPGCELRIQPAELFGVKVFRVIEVHWQVSKARAFILNPKATESYNRVMNLAELDADTEDKWERIEERAAELMTEGLEHKVAWADAMAEEKDAITEELTQFVESWKEKFGVTE